MIIISACLTGEDCRYDGKDFPTPWKGRLRRLVDEGKAMAVCPEVSGGLPTPRPCAELVEGRVMSDEGEDITGSFRRGCAACMEEIAASGSEPTLAVLKSRSPSCGLHTVYDGSFSGTLIEGTGVFAEAIRETFPELHCIDETELDVSEEMIRSLSEG